MRINKVLKLKGEQRTQLRADVSKGLEGLKPNIRRVLKRFKSMKLMELDFEAEFQFFQSEYEASVRVLLPKYSRYLSQMSPAQIERFRVQNEKSNDKILEQIKNANESNFEVFERMLGSLTDEQREMIKQNAGSFVNSRVDRLKRRKKYQKQLGQIFLQKEPSQRKSQIRELTLAYVEAGRNSQFREKFISTCKRVVSIPTPQQQNYFSEKVNDYSLWLEAFLASSFL